MTAVWIYVDTSKQIGDVDHLKVFTNADAAVNWFKDNDPEGVAFECEVLGGIKWKLGDVVRVKSGGPLMTVGSITKAGKVICGWVDAAGKPQRASLSPDALWGDPSEASLSDFGLGSVTFDSGDGQQFVFNLAGQQLIPFAHTLSHAFQYSTMAAALS